MGRELYDQFPVARDVYARANSLLGFNLARLCFEGPEEELARTEICQPAIFTTSLAAWEVVRQVSQESVIPAGMAGLSLGEYTALTAAGSLSFEDGLKLVWARGKFMEEAARLERGTMATVMGLSLPAVQEICEAASVSLANLNAPEHLVLSGGVAAMERAVALAKARGAKRVVELAVGGAFHSALMQPAAAKLRTVLESAPFHSPGVLVLSNVTAKPHPQEPAQIKELLARQLTSPVQWEECVRYLLRLGVRTFVEVGPGAVLKALLRRIEPSAEAISVQTAKDVQTLAEKVAKYASA